MSLQTAIQGDQVMNLQKTMYAYGKQSVPWVDVCIHPETWSLFFFKVIHAQRLKAYMQELLKLRSCPQETKVYLFFCLAAP